MFNNIIKSKSYNAFYMLRECFLRASRIHLIIQIITDATDDKLNKLIIKVTHNDLYDDLYHHYKDAH